MHRRGLGVRVASSPGRWRVTVGLEIHAQLATPQKLFSHAPNRFGGEVNRDVDVLDTALPGTQPRVNRHAVLLAVRAALAFGCEVNPASTFDRKHYFYPDQPSGYQITQNYNALAHRGSFSVFERDGTGQAEAIEIGVSQLQIEQDTARTTYLDDPPQALVDLNRNGTPLIEVVTTPSIPSAKAAGAALRKIQAILRAVRASDANMEAGGMRCDVNVSVTTDSDRHLGPLRRVEIKNLASGRIVMDAVEAESARQIRVLESGGSVGKETRGYDVERRETFLTRTKETVTDYRYMPEPDLGPVRITRTFLQKCSDDLPELPDAQLDRLTGAPYGLALRDARVLAQDPLISRYYEAVLSEVGLVGTNARTVCNWIVHELFGRQRVMAESSRPIHRVTETQLAELVSLVIADKLTGAAGKIVLQTILDGNENETGAIVEQLGLAASFSAADLAQVVDGIMEKNGQQAQKLREGDVKIKKWFVGQVMRATKGYFHPLSCYWNGSPLTMSGKRRHLKLKRSWTLPVELQFSCPIPVMDESKSKSECVEGRRRCRQTLHHRYAGGGRY